MPKNNCEDMISEERVKDQIGALIDKFYIENIKSVVFIDDEFSTLETLLKDRMNDASEQEEESLPESVRDLDEPLFGFNDTHQEDSHAEETEGDFASDGGESPYMCKARVYHLVSSAHKKGLLVDILNDYPPGNDFWKRADLQVLDFKVGGSADKTLQALNLLSDESEYNLVVVYTHENVGDAAESVNESLRCCGGTDPATARQEDACLYHKQVDLADHPWIACRNLFVVFVPKTHEERDAEIDDLTEALKSALNQYCPSPMEVLGRVVATDLGRNIHENIHKMLPSREDKASVLFASVHGVENVDDPDEGILALSRLLAVLFRKADSVLSESATKELSHLISEVRKGCLSEKNFQFVCHLEKAFEDKQYPTDHYAHLNKFICNDPCIPVKMTTGTIFSIKNEENKYYVCVSPECDMANNPKNTNSSCESGIIVKNISSVELKIENASKTNLKKLTKNQYILFFDEGVIKMGKVEPLEVHPRRFFLYETTPPKYYAVEEMISQSDEGMEEARLVCNEKTIRIVAQLRPEYAHRLMARAGAWHSRIGLDFISIPNNQ